MPRNTSAALQAVNDLREMLKDESGNGFERAYALEKLASIEAALTEEQPTAFSQALANLNEKLPLWQNMRDAREAITPILQMAEMADIVKDARRYRALFSAGLHIDNYDLPYVSGETLEREADLLLKGK